MICKPLLVEGYLYILENTLLQLKNKHFLTESNWHFCVTCEVLFSFIHKQFELKAYTLSLSHTHTHTHTNTQGKQIFTGASIALLC